MCGTLPRIIPLGVLTMRITAFSLCLLAVACSGKLEFDKVSKSQNADKGKSPDKEKQDEAKQTESVFDPNSLDRTWEWLMAHGRQLDNARDNAVAYRKLEEKYRAEYNALRGKQVKWNGKID
jgi:hypothetical protein